jgi:hypothetical protein
MTQNSIKEFVKKMEMSSDTTIEDFEADKKGKIVKELLLDYYSKSGKLYSEAYDENYELPNEEELFAISQMDKNSELYNLHQANILKFFMQLETLGNAMRDIMTSLNADTKGSGKSLIDANIKFNKYKQAELDEKSTIPWNANDSSIHITGIDGIANSDTQQGAASQIAYELLDKLFGQFYIYKKEVPQRVLSLFSTLTGKPSVNSLGENTIKGIFNSFKSYLLSGKQTELFDMTAQQERERLFKSTYDTVAPELKVTKQTMTTLVNNDAKLVISSELSEGTYQLVNGDFVKLTARTEPLTQKTAANLLGYETLEQFKIKDFKNAYFDDKQKSTRKIYDIEKVRVPITNPSLARRLMVIQKMLPDNYLLKRLTPELSRDLNRELDLVKYNAAVSQNIDDVENTKAFVEMLQSDDSTISEFAQDLIKYFYLTGGNITPQSFGQYIPSSLLLNSSYSKGLNEIQDSLDDLSEVNAFNFLKQYFQHNPFKAIKIADEEVGKMLDKKTNTVTISKDPELRSGYQEGLMSINRLSELEQMEQGLVADSIPFPFIYIYDKSTRKPKLYQLSSKGNNFVYNQISLLGTEKLGTTEYDITNENNRSIINFNTTNVRVKPVEKTEETIKVLPAIEATIIEKYGLSETFSKEPIQTILEQIKVSQNEDMGVIASILEANSDVQNTEVKLTPDLNAAGKANYRQIQFKSSELETNRMNTQRSVTNSDDFNFQTLAIHELLHIATSAQYNAYEKNPESVSEKERQVFEQLDKVKNSVIDRINKGEVFRVGNETVSKAGMEAFKKKYDSVTNKKDYTPLEVSVYYGLMNTKEFITASMTDENMQRFLNEIPYSGNKSLWDRVKNLYKRFVDALAKLSKIQVKSDSALEETLGNIINLIDNTVITNNSPQIEEKEGLNEDLALSITDDITVQNIDNYLQDLTASQRLAFTKLKRLGIIKTECN